jgi:hypothetical protein
LAGAKWCPLKGEALIDKLIACWSDWDSSEEYYLSVLAPKSKYSEHAESLINDFNGIEGFISDQFRSSALKALSRHAEPSDTELARTFLKREFRAFYDTDVALAALENVQKHGGPEDAELLKEHLITSDPSVRRAAGKSCCIWVPRMRRRP